MNRFQCSDQLRLFTVQSLTLTEHNKWDPECLRPLALPPSLRQLVMEDLWQDVSFLEARPPPGLQVELTTQKICSPFKL